MNLCTNAAHAMPDGGVLELRLARVTLEAEACEYYDALEPGDYAHFVVRDTGTGISPEVRERMFEPYFTTKDVGEGTGLGLAVVHGIVKSMHGDILVDSEIGVGTEVHVFLPAVHRRTRPTPHPPTKVPTGTERVLLVEDEPQVRTLVQATLHGLGYSVTAFAHGQEALAHLEAAPESVDAVVTDKTMPQMTGITLAQHIHARWPAMPVILCSGFLDPGAQDAARRAGVRHVLDKPVGRIALANTLREALDSRQFPPETSLPGGRTRE